MAPFDIDTRPSPRKVRLFAALWFPLLVVLVGARLLRHGAPPEVAAGVGIFGACVACLALVSPVVGRALFVGFSYLTYPLGVVVSYLLLAVIYFGVVTPIGLVARVFGYDPMQRRRSSDASTYWSRRPAPATMDRYFKQY